MTSDNILVLLILGAAVALFVWDKLRVDVVALMVLVSLVLTGLVDTGDAFAGFANPAVVSVWGVFIVSGAVAQAGVGDLIAQQMMHWAGGSPRKLLIGIMLASGLISSFMNNVGAVALLLPAVIAVGRQMRISPSKLLMPLAYSALLGGNMTLIGTPPNILASGLLKTAGFTSFSMFSFTPTGLLVLGAGVLYMIFIGQRLLPDHPPTGELADDYALNHYIIEVRVAEQSPLVGKHLWETNFGQQFDLQIVQVRHWQGLEAPTTERPIQAGDVLTILGPLDKIISVSQSHILQPVREWKSGDWHPSLETEGLKLVEVTLNRQSRFQGYTLKKLDFREKYSLSVLAMRHSGQEIVEHLGEVPVVVGDVLLVQGTEDKIELLRRNPNFVILDDAPIKTDEKKLRKAPLAVAILLLVIGVVTAEWLDIATMMVIGSLLMVLTRVINMDEAYRLIDWQAVFLIAAMLPLGTAMEDTGTAALLANHIVQWVGGWGPLAVLAGLSLFTALLTEVISNAAATVLMVPIAIGASIGMGVDPHGMVMATVIAASTSFLTPVGHQANVIIYGPGGYKFSDYARVGAGLNLVVWLIIVLFVPLFWPF